jgi:hypothetical protein
MKLISVCLSHQKSIRHHHGLSTHDAYDAPRASRHLTSVGVSVDIITTLIIAITPATVDI